MSKSKRVAPEQEPPPKKSKKVKGKSAERPPMPKTFSYAVKDLLIANWYDQGARVASVIVTAMTYVWSEDQERWLEQLELDVYPALLPRTGVRLLGTHGRWRGPRETDYELTVPNPREEVTARRIITQSAQLSSVEEEKREVRQKERKEKAPARRKYAESGYPPNAVIQMLVKKNPYRAGTVRALMHGLLKNNMTVGDYIKALEVDKRFDLWALKQALKQGQAKLVERS